MIQYAEDILTRISDNTIITLLIGVFGTLVSVWGGIRVLRWRRLSYRRIDIPFPNEVPQNDIDEQSADFIGKDMSVTEIAIWNSGTKYINSNDMARKEPLRIVARNSSRIIAQELLFCSCDSCDVQCNISKNHKATLIDFDYLERNQGCVIRIIYEGKKEDIQVQGVIKGKKQIKESGSVIHFLKKNTLIYDILTSKISCWIILFYCYFMCPVAYLQSANFGAIENNFFGIPNTYGGRFLDGVLIASLIIFTVGVSVPFGMRLIIPRLPKALEDHFGKGAERCQESIS